MAKPDGPQFVRVYHSSYYDVPPHRRPEPDGGGNYEAEVSNMHPDVIHAGTMEAARSIEGTPNSIFSRPERPYIHVYDIPVSKQHPVVYGDDFESTFEPSKELLDKSRQDSVVKVFNAKMSGVQPGLWETMEGTPQTALESNQAVPYRNRGEDPGSISWMIPKSAFHSKGVRHVGTIETKTLPSRTRESNVAHAKKMREAFPEATRREWNDFMKEQYFL